MIKPVKFIIVAALLSLPQNSAFASDLFSDQKDSKNPSENKKDATKVDDDSPEKKYGLASSRVKRLDSSMKDAQQVLTNTEFSYFQNKYSALKEKVSADVGQGMSGQGYFDSMKLLENELSNSMETARQNYGQNKQKLDQSMSHLRAVFAERSSQMSREDQEDVSEMIEDLQSRARGIASNADTANRMSSLAEEAANMETTIIGKTMFNSGRRPDPLPPPVGSRNGAHSIEQSEEKKPQEIWWTRSGMKLGPMPVEHKASLYQIMTELEQKMKQLSDRGILGSMDKDQFDRRLNQQKMIIAGTPGGKISQTQEEVIRKDLEDMSNELKEFSQHF